MSLSWETSLFFWHAALLLHRSLLLHGIVCMGMIARSLASRRRLTLDPSLSA
jgi:hypothetical protein